MMKFFTKCLWTGLLVLGGGVVPGGAETFQVVQDTYSTGGVISKAAGGAPSLLVDATHTAFIQFDLSAVNFTASQVMGARLVIYFPTATAGGSLQFFANSSGFS